MTMVRVQELCRKLKPVLGRKVDRLWAAYLAESDADGRADVWQMLELLAAKHIGQDYQPDRSPFPPPGQEFARSGDVEIGRITYGHRELYPFLLKSDRLKEHILVAGRSGSGKTNLTFVLMKGIMARGIKVVALDWKRGYRDLLSVQSDLRVYTIGRDVSPFRFNPLIPPPGCEPNVWIKLIVDVIASAYFGGEGVISLLVVFWKIAHFENGTVVHTVHPDTDGRELPFVRIGPLVFNEISKFHSPAASMFSASEGMCSLRQSPATQPGVLVPVNFSTLPQVSPPSKLPEPKMSALPTSPAAFWSAEST